MQASLLLNQRAVAAPARPARRSRRPLVTRAHNDDDEPLPLFRLPSQEVDLKKAPKPTPSLGGKTIGDELALIHKEYRKAEDTARSQMEAKLYSSNWAGDVYVGSNWNILTVLYLIFMLVPIFGLLAAWASYGVYWGLMPGM
ncbi:hypothetical protein Rsub_01966 [Raphidocelis subcapitata]|uniref:Uncharacterized protein n=1 Tax=Raphidocelis subcapitata TaxID=307507 RepID=A0A2V0NP69_9CHLO|nr:hypothetical protein Rsub_01966 [Raphidocelis subcapitata]|eukprot:GBF89394.1 hypothetical protein Rsub_01966 [Raphidocelis subcapitata]